jgi:hypothetical protein
MDLLTSSIKSLLSLAQAAALVNASRLDWHRRVQMSPALTCQAAANLMAHSSASCPICLRLLSKFLAVFTSVTSANPATVQVGAGRAHIADRPEFEGELVLFFEMKPMTLLMDSDLLRWAVEIASPRADRAVESLEPQVHQNLCAHARAHCKKSYPHPNVVSKQLA